MCIIYSCITYVGLHTYYMYRISTCVTCATKTYTHITCIGYPHVLHVRKNLHTYYMHRISTCVTCVTKTYPHITCIGYPHVLHVRKKLHTYYMHRISTCVTCAKYVYYSCLHMYYKCRNYTSNIRQNTTNILHVYHIYNTRVAHLVLYRWCIFPLTHHFSWHLTCYYTCILWLSIWLFSPDSPFGSFPPTVIVLFSPNSPLGSFPLTRYCALFIWNILASDWKCSLPTDTQNIVFCPVRRSTISPQFMIPVIVSRTSLDNQLLSYRHNSR